MSSLSNILIYGMIYRSMLNNFYSN